MAMMSATTRWLRLGALFAVVAMLVTACGPSGTSPSAVASAPASQAPTSEPPASEGPTGDLGTYKLGIFQDVETDNQWASADTSQNTVWNAYFLSPMTGSLYGTFMPGIEFGPVMADGDLQPTVAEGDKWIGTMKLRSGMLWSDGEPVTAADVAFTWHTVVSKDKGGVELLGPWQDFADEDVVDNVEATDDLTVKVTYNSQPGLAVWGPGTGVPQIPIMPEHYWKDIVADALTQDDPRTVLLAASGAEAPSLGATMFKDRQAGSFAASDPNPNYYDKGAEITSGGVTWTEGPYATAFQYTLYGGQDAAVLALANGEVDLLLNPLGMQRGFQDQVKENKDLTAIVNPTNGFRFLAFNHSRAPMSDHYFRDALTALIDKEFLTGNLLQGVAFPLYVVLPEGNVNWYNKEVADQLATEGYAGLDTATRRKTALDLLTEGKYTWETAPTIDADGNFTPGSGIIGPDGKKIGTLRLISPTASYDPLRATAAAYIAGVAQDMGIDVVAVPTDFGKIIDIVFATNDKNEYTADYDMFILGYSLGSAAFPTFHCSFYCTTGDSNNTKYSSAAFDAAADTFNKAQTIEEAYNAMWEMEKLIAKDKPHVPLFDTGILEFYSNRVAYPFTDTLSGLQFINGNPSAVTAAK